MSLSLFTDPEEACLIERPNRFVMIVSDSRGERLRLHCPNPGKLTEFLIPGQKILMERAAAGEDRKTDGTAVAVCYKKKIIYLQSSKANNIAGKLVLPRLYPEYDIRPEKTIGSSRFDFLLSPPGESPEKAILTEVKSCSLCEEHLAMFPDTPSERASRHVEELIELGRFQYKSEVLFVISHRDAESFMPNPHTDPRFALTLHRARIAGMAIRAVSVDTTEKGDVALVDPEIPVETENAAALGDANRGVYFLVIHVEKAIQIPVSRIGSPLLRPGWYVYAGSARVNLQQRITRHLRKRKKVHWHIDHLTTSAAKVKAFPIATFKDLECTLAADIAELAEASLPGFGCSDCSCSSHLFSFSANPLHREAFVELLFRYRHREFM